MRPDPVRIGRFALPYVSFQDEHDSRPVAATAPLLAILPRHVGRSTKSGRAVSFAVYAPGASRGKAGVVEVTALVLDFDHLGTEAAREVVRTLRDLGWAHLLYSSYSHRAAGDDDNCFRLVLLTDRPISPLEFPTVWAAVNEDLGGLADPKARDVSRLWFTPSCPPGRLSLAVYDHRDGEPMDVDAMLERRVIPDQPPPGPRRPIQAVCARPDLARRIARYRLNHEPEVRLRAAERLQARVLATRATRILCPQCGRPSVWFWLDPTSQRTAACNHRKTCGWWGFLDALLDGTGGPNGG